MAGRSAVFIKKFKILLASQFGFVCIIISRMYYGTWYIGRSIHVVENGLAKDLMITNDLNAPTTC